MDKKRRKENLFILVCYLMLSKGNTDTSTPYNTTMNKTQESTTTDNTTTNNETSTTGTSTTFTYWNGKNSTDTNLNETNTSGTYPNGTSSTGTYPNGTNSTGTIPKWIPTIVISIICGLLFIITITTIVCHSRKIANSDVESDGGAHEYVDVSKNDIPQTQENLNKSPNKHRSKAMPPEKEEKTNIDIISGMGDYDEVLLDGTPTGKSLTEKDECHVLAKSRHVSKKDVAFSDIEAKESSSKKESSKRRESPVYTQSKTNNVYSHVPSNLNLKNKAESFATSENQHVQGNQENVSYYDHVDLNATRSNNAETESLDMNYDHINFNREPNMGPERDFTSQPFSIENILLEDHYDNGINSLRDDINAVGASELYSKVSAKYKHDQEADKHILDGDKHILDVALEREDSNYKVSEQEKVVVETDTDVYHNIDKLKNSSKSTDKEHDLKPENKPVITQSLVGLKIASQKQESDTRNKSKELSSVSGMAKLGNINLENMENVSVFTPNVSVTNDVSEINGGENLKAGSKFRIKEKNYNEAKPAEYQQSTKSQKSVRSDYEEVETAL